jgi:PAS domain S-box-containing protein
MAITTNDRDRPAHRRQGEQEILPARTAARLTFALALILTVVLTMSRPATPGRSGDLLIYWGLVVVDAYVAFSPRFGERARALFVTGSWGVAGLAALWSTGLGSGPAILMVTVGLAGLFFGLRAALGAAGLTGLMLLAVVWVEATRSGAPHHDWVGPGQFGDWFGHAVTIFGISVMSALVQAETQRRAHAATERARHFALAVELTDNCVVVTDAAGRIEWVNDAFTRLTGWPAEQASGKAPGALLSGPATRPDVKAFIRERVKAGEPFTCEIVNYCRDGRPYWNSLEVRPFRHEDGPLRGFTGIQSDVTAARIGRELAEFDAALGGLASDADQRSCAMSEVAALLARLSNVLLARIWQPGAEGGWSSWAKAVHPEGRHAAADLAAWAASLGMPGSGEGAGRSPHVVDGPIPGVRVVMDVVAEQPGEPQFRLEIVFDPAMPGQFEVIAHLPVVGVRLRGLCAARAERMQFEALFQHSPDAVLLLGADGNVRQVNARALALCGQAALGRPVESCLTGIAAFAEQMRMRLAAADDANDVGTLAWEQAGPDGRTYALEASAAQIELPGARGMLVAVRDVTSRRQAERALEVSLAEASRSLAEREVLLAEVHHRVKNNLQIISSLLSMQAERSTSEEARGGLMESVHRVRSMALIHRMLYGNVNLAEVDIAHYALAMARELGGSLGGGVPIRVQSQALHLTVEQAIPFGLILNELLTNALKHGHRPGERSEVSVRISVVDGHAELQVRDQGPGLPEGFEWRGTSSLGAVIVDALTRQLGGALTVRNDPGACFELRLPVRPTSSAPGVSAMLSATAPAPAP